MSERASEQTRIGRRVGASTLVARASEAQFVSLGSFGSRADR